MHFHFRPSRAIAASVAIACFGTGVASAQGAYAVDKTVATHQAREAATAYAQHREDLATSLSEAEAVVDEASSVTDDDVEQAAASLSDATTMAKETAAEAQQTASTVAGVESPTSSASSDSRTDRPGDVDDADVSTPSDKSATNPLTHPAEDELATAEFKDPDEAREATEALDAAAEELQETARSLEAKTAAVAGATEEALLGELTDSYRSTVDSTQKNMDRADALVARVGTSVADAATLEDYGAARAAVDELADAPVTAQDSAVAQAQIDKLSAAAAHLDEALAGVRRSHEAWVSAENARIDSANAEAQAADEDALKAAKQAHVEANRAAVAQYSNGHQGRPDGVSGSNGRLTSASLCSVDFAPGHTLQCDAAQALEEADAAYQAQTGRHLVMTDSYRSYQVQVSTRLRKPATAAMPGTSNHGWGMAVDLDPASAAWLTEHGADYGWVHPAWARSGGSKPESWHLEYVADKVGAFEKPRATPPAAHVTSVFDEPADTNK